LSNSDGNSEWESRSFTDDPLIPPRDLGLGAVSDLAASCRACLMRPHLAYSVTLSWKRIDIGVHYYFRISDSLVKKKTKIAAGETQPKFCAFSLPPFAPRPAPHHLPRKDQTLTAWPAGKHFSVCNAGE